MVKTKKQEVSPRLWYALAVTRILLGFVFLWAFIDKLFGLGFATKAAKAWANGGSPTTGFLSNVEGPFANLFTSLAGQAWADWLFMLGLLGIGISLVLGVAIRLGTAAGSLLLFMMWMASLPLANNPVIDDHISYIGLLIVIAYGLSQQKLSLAAWWQGLAFVKSTPWLK